MRTINKLTKLVLSFLLVITCINFSIVEAEDGSDENYSEPTAVETISEEPASEPEQEVIPEEPAATEEIIVDEPVAEEPVVEEAAPVEEEKQEEVVPEVIEEAKVEEENNTPEIEAEPATQEETVEPEVQQEAPVEPEVEKVETVEEVKVTVVVSYVDENDHSLTDPITGSYPTEYRLDENVDAFKSFDGYDFEKVIVNDDAKNTISKDDVQKNGLRITKDMTSLKLVYQKINLESNENKEVIPEVTEEASEEAEPESNTNETELSAFDQTAFAGKVAVHASAAEGVLPKGARLIVEQVNRKAILNAVENTVSDNNKEMDSAVALDISIVDKDGNKIQPNGIVNITFVNTGVSGDEVKIYHVEDDASAVTEIANNTDSFDASHFSIYVIAGENEVPLATYRFNANGSVVSTQIVKTGDSLITPTAPEMNGKAFVGWYDGETKFEDFNTALTINETTTREITAKYEDALYVYFYNPDGTKIMRTQKVADHDGHDYSSITYDVDATHKLVGWAAKPNGKDNIATNIAVPKDEVSTSVYAIIEEGYWVTFDSDGGSNIDSQFVFDTISLNGITPTKPGYTFAGWYNGEEKVENGTKVTAPMTLKAHWNPSEVNYTINYWQQKVTDDKDAADDQKHYDYVSSEIKKATTGSLVSAENTKSYNGFKYNANNSSKDVAIAGDGTTIINVYYDRVLCTVNFYIYESSVLFYGSWKINKTVTGLYGASLPEGAWDTSSYLWHTKKDGGSNAVLLTSFDFETAGYAGNEGNVKTGKIVTTCNFYGRSKGRTYTINYYNEQADGTFKKVQTVGMNQANLTVHEKYDGYELYKYSTGSNANETAGYWSRQKAVKDGNAVYGETINIASKLKKYSLSYYNYNGVVRTKSDIKYTASLKTYGSFVPDRPLELPEYYHFDGWYKDKAGTTKFDFDTETMPNANLQVYAKWTASNIQFKYSLNKPESSNTPETIAVEAGTIANTVLPPVPEINDYSFAGWYVADGNGDLTTEVFHAEDAIVRNTSVIGKWLYNGNLTVTYSPGTEGDNATVPTDTKVYAGGANVTVGANATTTSKKKFLGWQLNGNLYQPGASFEINKDLATEDVVTLTAIWGSEEASTTLTYNPGNGRGTATTVPVLNNAEVTIKTHDADPLKFSAPVVEGKEYYFAGWATSMEDANNGKATYAAGQTVHVDVNGENVLYATWIEKAVITLVANSNTVTYNGEAQSVEGFQDVADGYIVSGLSAKATGTNVGEYTAEIKGTATVEKDGVDVTDKVVVKKVPGQLTISPRPVTVAAENKTKVYGAADPELTAKVSGTVGNDKVAYTLARAEGENVGTYTITASGAVSQGNYTVTCTPGTFEITKAETLVLTASLTGEAAKKVYDGEALANGATPSVTEGTTVSYRTKTAEEGEWTDWTDEVPSLTDVGKLWIEAKADNDNYKTVTVPYDLEVTPRTVKFTSATDSKPYDGTPLTNENVSVSGDGFAEGEGATFAVIGTITNVGTKANTFGYAFNKNTLASNYNISTELGTLTITPKSILPDGPHTPDDKKTGITVENPADVKYDGKEHAEKPIVKDEKTGATLKEGKDYEIVYPEDIVNAGEITATVNGKGNYDGSFEIKYNILKRDVTFTSATDSKKYDGTALTNGNVEITGDGFAEGEGATFDVTGTITNTGSTENTFTFELNEGTLASNYNIEANAGTLTITPKSIIPDGPHTPDDKKTGITVENPADVKYDGKEHAQKPIVKDGKTGVTLEEGKDHEIVYPTDIKNAGTVTATVKGIGDYNGSFEIKYNILKRDVTFTSATDSKQYDGNAFTNGSVEITGDGFVEGEGVTFNVTGSITDAGSTKNTFTYVMHAGTNAGNYNVTVVEGTLTVTAAPVVPRQPETPQNPPARPSRPSVPARAETQPVTTTPAPEATVEPAKVEPTPAPTAKPEKIKEEATPQAAVKGHWALINLIAAMLSVVLAVAALLAKHAKEEDEEDKDDQVVESENQDDDTVASKRHRIWKIVAVVDAIAAVVVFILTENLAHNMVLVDKWTVLMVLFGLISIVSTYFARKWHEEDEDEDEQSSQNA